MARTRRRIVVVAGLGSLVSLALGVAVGTASSPEVPADFDGKGSPAWVDADGSVHPERIPELTPVIDAGGNRVGFVRREDLYPELFSDGSVRAGPDAAVLEPSPEELPVYSEDGDRVGSLPANGGTFEADE
ncbi:hypothetical protein FTX61_18915 [Nitriliruptoraceae bacterium ZYF776]|nr:hypothetical protein [Profundirhabdus halotolerans]